MVESDPGMSTIEATGTGPSPSVVWAQRSLVATTWIAALVGWQVYRSSNGLSTTEAGQEFIDTVGNAWWGVFAYVGLYLARPISRAEYVLGKMAVLAILLSPMTWVMGVFIFFLQVYVIKKSSHRSFRLWSP